MSTAAPDLRAEWERGVALGSRGRYADAWEVLDSVSAVAHDQYGEGPSARRAQWQWLSSLALSTAASLHRQCGRHAAARDLDVQAMVDLGLDHDPGRAITATDRPVRGTSAPADWTEAVLDATLGLAADAIGHVDTDLAQVWLERAEQVLTDSPEPRPWRAPIRLHWVRAELALMRDQPDHAARAAATAVTLGERAASARHVAKSRLIHGVARTATDPIAAAAGLRSSLALSVPAGWRPLQWPAYLMLADLEADPRYLSAAGMVIRSIAVDTPASIAAEWMARSEVRRCLAAPDV